MDFDALYSPRKNDLNLLGSFPQTILISSIMDEKSGLNKLPHSLKNVIAIKNKIGRD